MIVVDCVHRVMECGLYTTKNNYRICGYDRFLSLTSAENIHATIRLQAATWIDQHLDSIINRRGEFIDILIVG